jgi:hypothetical protein
LQIIHFRRLEEPIGPEEYLVDYDFIDARNNAKQPIFYEKLEQIYPKKFRKKESMSVIAVNTLEKAEQIFDLADEHGANVTLRIAKTLKKNKAEE